MGAADKDKEKEAKKEEKDEAVNEKDEESPIEQKDPALGVEPTEVFIHSLPLLSTVDHHTRLKSKKGKRVVGVLLGHNVDGRVYCTNSFAVPFEEDNVANVWFFDTHYLEDMFAMFKKVNTKEAIVGWYSTGSKLKQNDMEVHQLLRRYCPHPVYLIVRVNEDSAADTMPCTSYKTVEEIESVTTGPKLTFVHLRTTLKCSPMEEVGVVHLLRDIQDYTTSSLATQVKEKVNGLKAICLRLQEIKEYMDMVVEGKLPMNHNVMYIVQDIFNTLPSLHTVKQSASLATEVNDQTMVLYLGSLLRSVVALHNLILNKFDIKRQKAQEEEEARQLVEKEKKAKEEKEKEEKEKAAKKSAEEDSKMGEDA